MTYSNVVIRRALEDDIDKLAANLMPEPRIEQVSQRWQEHQDGHREMLIAESNEKIIGTVSITGHLHRIPDSLRLFALDVGPAYRRRGVGTALMEAVEEKARHRGLTSVNLEVGVDNRNAMRLYERRGYQRLGDPEIVVEELSWIMIKLVWVTRRPVGE